MAILATGEAQYRRPVPAGGRQTWCGACVSVSVEAGVSTLFIYQWVQSEAAVPVPASPEAGVSVSLRDRLIPPKGR